MSDYRLNAETRTTAGKGSSRRLRRLDSLVPGVIYGGDKAPQSIQVAHKDLSRALEEEAFYSSVITLTVDGTEEPVILKALQRHPARPIIMHADFQRASSETILKVHVPVHFINESTCIAVKQQGGIVHHEVAEVEVSCASKDLPEFITVDLISMEIDQVLHLSDLTPPPGVTFTALAHGSDLPIVSIHKAKGSTSESESGEGA